jgi:hypothetical protein
MRKMPTINQARIPIRNRLRRIRGSPSFKATGVGEYSIIRNGAPHIITTKAEIGHGQINLFFKNEDRVIGIFQAQHDGKGVWDIYHRDVFAEYKGYNIGRHGFGLIAQQIKKEGGTRINVRTNQKEVIRTLLKLGYKLPEEHKVELAGRLGLAQTATIKEIIAALEGAWMKHSYVLTLFKHLK